MDRTIFGITLSVCVHLSICTSDYLSSCLCVQFCLDSISCTSEPFLTRLGMVVYYHEAECQAERTYIIKIRLFLQYFLNCWYVCSINLSVMWENGITAFKVKVTEKVKNVSEYTPGWYLVSFYDGHEVFVWSNCLLDLGTDFLVSNMVFVWDA